PNNNIFIGSRTHKTTAAASTAQSPAPLSNQLMDPMPGKRATRTSDSPFRNHVGSRDLSRKGSFSAHLSGKPTIRPSDRRRQTRSRKALGSFRVRDHSGVG